MNKKKGMENQGKKSITVKILIWKSINYIITK